jgi:hypothetical protein
MVTGLIGLALVASTAFADETLRERCDLLLKEYKAMDLGWSKQFEGRLDEPVERLIARYEQWPAWKYLPRFHQIVTEDPNSPAAGDALFWILDIGRAIGVNDEEYSPILELCLDLLAKSPHLEDERMSLAFRYDVNRPSPVTEPFVRLAIEKCQSREIRAHALLALGRLLKSRAEIAQDPWFEKVDMAPFPKFVASRIDPRVRKYLKDTDAPATLAEAESVLKKLVKEYGDVIYAVNSKPGGHSLTMAEMAQPQLDEIQISPITLGVGKPAPEIEGSGLDGKPMSLNAERGKVVVLVFWKSTSESSMALVPRLERLADRQAGQAMRCLGVNSDADRPTALALVERAKILRSSWWDRDAEGSIRKSWAVSSIPAIFVLDAKGVIRHRSSGEPGDFESIVAALLEETAKPK